MGWNQRSLSNKPKLKKNKVSLFSAVSFALCIAVCVLFFFLFFDKSGPRRPLTSPRERRPVARSAQALSTFDVSDVVKEVANADVYLDDPATRVVLVLNVRTNLDGSVTERYQTADGKTHSVRHSPPQIWDYATDQAIAMAIVGLESTYMMPPMPTAGLTDEEFLESLNKPITINDDDAENVKRLKEIVASTRRIVKQMMDEGKSFSAILSDQEFVHNSHVEAHARAIEDIKGIRESGDEEGAKAALEAYNDAFRAMDIPEISMPETSAERRERIRAEHN